MGGLSNPLRGPTGSEGVVWKRGPTPPIPRAATNVPRKPPSPSQNLLPKGLNGTVNANVLGTERAHCWLWRR